MLTKQDEYNQLREILLNERRKKGLTQVDIANILGKPQSFVSKYESGERKLDVMEFIKVCKALKIDPATIMTQLENNNE